MSSDPQKPRDRDRRLTTTPAHGSPASRAITNGDVPRESWQDAKTPVNAPDLETLMFRSGVTKQHAIEAANGIAEVRRELTAADTRLAEKLDDQAAKLSDLRVTVGTMDGKLDVLTTTLREQLATVAVAVTAKVEVDKAERLDVVEARKHRRQLSTTSIVMIVAPIVAALAALITALAKGGT